MKIPYQPGSDTSKAAADSQKAKAPATIDRIYRYLLGQGERGATDDEIKRSLGLLPSTAGARRRDLEMMGGCTKTKMRRNTMNGGTAVVHVAIPGATLSNKRLPGRPKKDKKHTEKLMTYLLPETLEDLKVISEKTGFSMAALVRMSVLEFIENNRWAKDRPEPDAVVQYRSYVNEAIAKIGSE